MAYEYLKPYILKEGSKQDTDENSFYPVKEEEIKKAEEKMGYTFPTELRLFFEEIGYGFLTKGVKSSESKEDDFYGANRINDPLTNADIFINREDSGLISQDTCEDLGPDDLPFFEICDSSRFLMMKLGSENPNAVWALGDIKIEDSFEKFIWRLYHESPWFYDDIIDKYYGRS